MFINGNCNRNFWAKVSYRSPHIPLCHQGPEKQEHPWETSQALPASRGDSGDAWPRPLSSRKRRDSVGSPGPRTLPAGSGRRVPPYCPTPYWGLPVAHELPFSISRSHGTHAPAASEEPGNRMSLGALVTSPRKLPTTSAPAPLGGARTFPRVPTAAHVLCEGEAPRNPPGAAGSLRGGSLDWAAPSPPVLGAGATKWLSCGCAGGHGEQ